MLLRFKNSLLACFMHACIHFFRQKSAKVYSVESCIRCQRLVYCWHAIFECMRAIQKSYCDISIAPVRCWLVGWARPSILLRHPTVYTWCCTAHAHALYTCNACTVSYLTSICHLAEINATYIYIVSLFCQCQINVNAYIWHVNNIHSDKSKQEIISIAMTLIWMYE